jgi:hypothetical protein
MHDSPKAVTLTLADHLGDAARKVAAAHHHRSFRFDGGHLMGDNTIYLREDTREVMLTAARTAVEAIRAEAARLEHQAARRKAGLRTYQAQLVTEAARRSTPPDGPASWRTPDQPLPRARTT